MNNHEWVRGDCFAYKEENTSQEYADLFTNYSQMILEMKGNLSVVIYTQITDTETECDGILNYDRSDKFTQGQIQQIDDANQNMINGMV